MISKKWGLPSAHISAANHILDLKRQGCPPLFCGFDTHTRKNWGQFRRRDFTATNR